jgi:hypothetical protein
MPDHRIEQTHGQESNAFESLDVQGNASVGGALNLTGIQRITVDAATTIASTTSFVDFAVDASSSRIVTMPAATVGRHIKVFWSVEQESSDRVFTGAGTDTFVGNIFSVQEGNAAGDGDVVAIADTTVAITVVDDVNIGSVLDFYCFVAGTWAVQGHLVLDVVGSVPTLA